MHTTPLHLILVTYPGVTGFRASYKRLIVIIESLSEKSQSVAPAPGLCPVALRKYAKSRNNSTDKDNDNAPDYVKECVFFRPRNRILRSPIAFESTAFG
uniref:Uncharacterized protein n=1 Tax=Candidatus Kentrum sp. DK TaxID=2126562 RepID=A0A450RUI8_9GAMM|nr:MAG: hypothetical protein BECKDK2373C_GA0170839_100260 [Candidatus Kentron sp. DK]